MDLVGVTPIFQREKKLEGPTTPEIASLGSPPELAIPSNIIGSGVFCCFERIVVFRGCGAARQVQVPLHLHPLSERNLSKGAGYVLIIHVNDAAAAWFEV